MNDKELAFIRLEQLKLAKTVALEIIRDCSSETQRILKEHFDLLIEKSSK